MQQYLASEAVKCVGVGLLLMVPLLLGCSDRFSTKKEDISRGQITFEKMCSACHNFSQDGIGPHLGGITQEVSADWLAQFIKNPRMMMLDDADERAARLLEEYQVFMPGFQMLDDQQLTELLAYMNTFGQPDHQFVSDSNLVEVLNPVEDTIEDSDLVLNLEMVALIPPSSEEAPRARINLMVCERASGRLFVADLRGKIYQVNDGEVELFFDIRSYLSDFIDAPGLHTGLGSFAFHPDFSANGMMYTTHAEPARNATADEALPADIPSAIQYVISEWQTDQPDAEVFEGTHREILRFDMVTGKHGLQEIAFNPHATEEDHPDYGHLYIGVGDAASVEEGYPQFSHHEGKFLWSSILRIDPLGRDAPNGQYGIPDDNPFVADDSKRDELYAYGFRNPNQLSWDAQGSLFATDIGLRNIEELNIIEAGGFYGWPLREGQYHLNYRGNQGEVYEIPAEESGRAVVNPLIERDHDDLKAIIGGLFYSGHGLSDLGGKYIFGDITSGDLFFADAKSLDRREITRPYKWQIAVGGKPTTLRQVTGHRRVDLRFGEDCAGDLYIFTKADGKIWRVTELVPPSS